MDIPAQVVKTRTIQQGLTAMMGYNPEAKLDDNVREMAAMMTEVKSLQVTQAVRDTMLDGVEIHHGDWMGIIDGDIAVVSKKLQDTAIESVAKMLDSDSEIVTIIVGEGTKLKDADRLKKAIEALDDDLEIEVHEGKQPLYPFLISVE